MTVGDIIFKIEKYEKLKEHISASFLSVQLIILNLKMTF